MKPIITKTYPELTLESSQKWNSDHLRIIFEKKKIIFCTCIDHAGNEFELTYEELKKYLE